MNPTISLNDSNFLKLRQHFSKNNNQTIVINTKDPELGDIEISIEDKNNNNVLDDLNELVITKQGTKITADKIKPETLINLLPFYAAGAEAQAANKRTSVTINQMEGYSQSTTSSDQSGQGSRTVNPDSRSKPTNPTFTITSEMSKILQRSRTTAVEEETSTASKTVKVGDTEFVTSTSVSDNLASSTPISETPVSETSDKPVIFDVRGILTRTSFDEVVEDNFGISGKQLTEKAQQNLEKLTKEANILSKKIKPDATNWLDALGSLESQRITSSDEVMALYKKDAEQTLNYLKKKRWIPQDTQPVKVVEDKIRLGSGASVDPTTGVFKVETGDKASDVYLPPNIKSTSIHELVHTVDVQKKGASENPLAEGLAYHIEQKAYEAGDFYETDAEKLQALKWLMIRNARVIKTAELQKKQTTPDAAKAYLIKELGMSEAQAKSEVEMMQTHPLQKISYVGGSEGITALWEKAHAKNPGMTYGQFLAKLYDQGQEDSGKVADIAKDMGITLNIAEGLPSEVNTKIANQPVNLPEPTLVKGSSKVGEGVSSEVSPKPEESTLQTTPVVTNQSGQELGTVSPAIAEHALNCKLIAYGKEDNRFTDYKTALEEKYTVTEESDGKYKVERKK